jgi:protein-S-isoprenylcysteine O-methyltransferase Ste14
MKPTRLSTRHGIYAGLGLGFIADPVLVRDLLLVGGAAALVLSCLWIWATGRSL